MVILRGENLGKRQQDLNKQVHDVATRKDDFDKIKMEPNSTDADVMFKIDLASKYKNVDYILDILKSGDSLYISRALKCNWLCDDDFSNVINVDYLHHHIFPSMSFKMKRKLLTTISMHLKNEDRSESFYTYCIGAKLSKNALKFLIFTSESFKLEIIEKCFYIIDQEEELFIRNFVGDSLTLATAIMEASNYQRSTLLYFFRYLISVSENAYLDMLEKYGEAEAVGCKRFGLRISTTVLKKHKSRLLEHPSLYVNRLNKHLIGKYINTEDSKIIAVQILPKDSKKFWSCSFCNQYDFLINKIPSDEKFQFVKKIFNEKYPNEDFEMSERFFDLCYQDFMTVEEREAWALRHIETNTEMRGKGRNYLWYEYVNFERAFPEIKKVILVTPNVRERHDVVGVLVKSVRNHKDMKTLLTYYYDRHINEDKYCKENFVTAIIDNHNVYEFDNDCWTVFNKLLHSLNVYKSNDICGSTIIMYMAFTFHIIHNIDLPKPLEDYILENHFFHPWVIDTLNKKISKENLEQIYQRIVKVYIDKITVLSIEEHQDYEIIKPYIQRYATFVDQNKKSPDDIPDFIMEMINDHLSDFKYISIFKKNKHAVTEAYLMRQLKKDSKLVVAALPELKTEISKDRYPPLRINSFLKKLKVYFPNDVTKEYLKVLVETLSEKEGMRLKPICSVVYGIFQLADDQTKIDIMAKYAPTEPKIKHDEIDERLLLIQEGICRSFCFSRPPVPLSNVLEYVKGDYLKFCLPIFQCYQAKLPQPLLQEFATKLLESPVSIQKHALRLLFECFGIDNLKKTIIDSWKRTKNISLRYVLYQSLCNKIRVENENIQVELFEVLKKFTNELKDDDNADLYKCYMNDINFLPEKLRGEYVLICWQTVSKFPDNTENYWIKKIAIDNLTRTLHLLDGNTVKEIVEDHVKHMLVDKNIRPNYKNRDLDYLYEAKWKLVVTYIIYYSSDKNFVHKNMDFVRLIMNKCVEMWHEINDDVFTYRKFCWQFIEDLIDTSTDKCCADAIPIFETVLTVLKDSFALSEYYRAFWSLQLTILRRKAKQMIKVNYYSSRNPNLIQLVKIAIHDYGLQVAKLVKESTDLKSYCISMNDDIGDMIKCNINDIMSVNIDNKDESYYESLRDVEILAADGLTDVTTVEAYLLALYILPMDSDCSEYNRILNKIKLFDSVEVQACWNKKFVYSDFKRRKLN